MGHGRREIADAVHAQMIVLEDFNAFGDIANEPALELARRLADLAPMPDAKVFFTTGGGEAVDTAAKLARRYWSVLGLPQRVHVIGRMAGYHGTNGFGTSIGGIEANRAGFGPLVPHTSYVPFDSFEALEAEILRLGSENVAAFFMEPVMGAGGVNLPPENYVEGVADVCERHGVLLICDSVICGFGRLGSWYGIERWGVEPDMITFAKGVTSGYLPLGGVVTSSRVAEPFWTGDGALVPARRDVLRPPDLLCRGHRQHRHPGARGPDRARRRARGRARRRPASARRPSAGHRGACGHRSHGRHRDRSAGLAAKVAVAARERGVMPRALVSSVAVSPPLTIQQPELELIGSTLREALDDVLEQAAPHNGAASAAARSTTAR